MIFKKVICIVILSVVILASIQAQMNTDNSVLEFADYKVDNDFINSKDLKYTLFGGSYQNYFTRLKAIDAVRHTEKGFVYGCAAEEYLNIIYYFDETMKNKIFGYNKDSGRSYIVELGNVAVTRTGKIYAVDKFKHEIYFWDMNNESYLPEGTLDRQFRGVGDISKDGDDNLYILDNRSGRIYKYNTLEEYWYTFNTGNDYIDLTINTNYEWYAPSGIVVNSNGIFISYYGGAIVKYSQTGEFQDYYWIDDLNLGLFSSRIKEATETWLVSIAAGPEDNIYVADSKAGKIHIFTEDLDYICSWEDPEKPIEEDIKDISFVSGEVSFFVTYPWGFLSYTKQNTLAAVQLSDNYIYPELVGDQYTGLGIELNMVGRGGYLDIIAEGLEDVRIIDSRRLSENEHFSYTWNGRNITGDIVSFGEYTLSFLLDDHLVKQIPFSIRKAPEISLTVPEDRVVGSSHSAVLFNFDIIGSAFVRISLSEYNDKNASEKILSETVLTTGSFSQNVDETDFDAQAEDGYYAINFDVAPSELSGISGIYKRTASTVLLDNNLLFLGQIENESSGFNPANPNLAEMNASFFISEGAFVSAEILDDNFNVVSTLFSDIYYGAGENTLAWNGKDNDSSLVNDSRYKFSLTAEQTEIDVSLSETGELFELDTTAPVIDCNISQIDIDGQTVNFPGTDNSIYISNDEASSIGIKDNLTASVSYNEAVTFSSDIYSGNNLTRTIIDEALLAENVSINSYWDGRDVLGSVVEDGLYSLRVQAEDEYGNESHKNVKVWVDNNRLDESIEEEIFESEVFQVNSSIDGNQYCPSIITTDNGFVLTWQSSNQDGSGYGIYAQRFDNSGNRLGDEFQVNTYTINNQERPSIAQLDGGFVITWNSYSQDGSEYGIYAQ